MNKDETKPPPPPAHKTEPGNVAAGSEEKAKEKTDPLLQDAPHRQDQQEGDMHNGELGAGLGNNNAD